MFRTHGRLDLLREDEAIDELALRVRRVRTVALRGVVALALVSAAWVAWIAASGGLVAGAVVTGKAIGVLSGSAFVGVLYGGHVVALQITRAWAERLARAMARVRRCDEEPLVEAARLFSGGSSRRVGDDA
jgi:hypothetical protein